MAEQGSLKALIREIVDSEPEPKGYGGWYSYDGDCVFFHAEDVPYHAVRLGQLVTVYEAMENDRPVGLQIKGIRTTLAKTTEFTLQLAKFIDQGEDIQLSYLVAFAMRISRPEPEPDRERIWRAVESSSRWRVPARMLQDAAKSG